MGQTFELINVVTFSELTGLSKIDVFVLIKKYGRNAMKSANDWHAELEKDFVIPNDIRVPLETEQSPAVEPEPVKSKSKEILEKLNNDKNKEE